MALLSAVAILPVCVYTILQQVLCVKQGEIQAASSGHCCPDLVASAIF